VGRAGTTEHVERIIRGWRRVDRQVEAREAARQHASRALHVYPDTDGTVTVRGRLTPEIGALLVQALTAARERLYQQAHAEDAGTGALDVLADTPTMAQQQADALALLAETALHHGIDPGAPGERYQVVVHVGPRGRRTRSSWNVPAPGVRRQPGGDAPRPGRPSRGGRCANPDDSPSATPGAPPPRPRLPLPGLWGPLRTRPSHSSLGAGRSHHVVESRYALSPAPPRGPRGGYGLDRQPDGELRFRRPSGQLLPEVPPPCEVPDDPVKVLRAWHDAEGLVLHAHTATPGWLGVWAGRSMSCTRWRLGRGSESPALFSKAFGLARMRRRAPV